MKKIAIVFLILFCSMVILGRYKEKSEATGAIILSPDTNLHQLITKKYSNQELEEIIAFAGPMPELNSQYKIECIRKKEDIYRVVYCGESSIAILLFNSDGIKIWSELSYPTKSKEDFRLVKKGQSRASIAGFDSNEICLFPHTGRQDIPKVSNHYTTDGYMIEIWYDDSYIITEIIYTLI